MAIAYGGAGARAGYSPAASSWSVPYPTTVNVNDLLVLHIVTSGGSVTTPSGWTEVHRETTVTNPRGGIFIKVANGTETGDLAVTVVSTTGNAVIHRYTGVDPVTPLDAAGASVSDSAGTDTVSTLPSITTVTANAMLVYANGANSGTVRMSSTTGTERFDFGATGGTGTKAGALYDEAVAATGATGARTITLDAARADWGSMMALRPAGASSPLSTSPAGIASEEAAGTPAVGGSLTASPTGIATGQAVGTPAVAATLSTSPAGIASEESFGSPAITGRPAMATLVDSFTGHDTTRWTAAPEAVFANGELSLPANPGYPGIWSNATYDLTDSHFSLRIVATPSASNGSTEGLIDLYKDSSNGLQMLWSNSNLVLREKLAGVFDDTSVPYSATDHRWWRIRSEGTTIHWETSPDNASWTARRSKVTTIALTHLSAAIFAGNWNAAPAPGTFVVDDVNQVPAIAAAGGIASGEGVGSPELASTVTVEPPGIGPSSYIGTVAVSQRLTATPVGIPGAAAFGEPEVAVATSAPFTVSPGGIGAGAAFGTPSVRINRTVSPAGIPSLESFGTPRQTNVLVTFPEDIPPLGSGMGHPVVSARLAAAPAGIAAGAVFGTPQVIKLALIIRPSGPAAGEAFGAPRVIGGSAATPYEMEGAMGARRHSGRLSAPGTTSQQPNRWEGRLG